MNGLPANPSKRHAAVERSLDRAHCVEHVASRDRSGTARRAIARLVHQRLAEARPFTLREMQTQPHRVGHGQDVREEYRRVEGKAGQWLQRHLGREIGARAQVHEATGALSRGVVLRQVAPGLPHQPYRRVRRRLAAQGAQQRIVLQCASSFGDWSTENHVAARRECMCGVGIGTQRPDEPAISFTLQAIASRPQSRSSIASGELAGSYSADTGQVDRLLEHVLTRNRGMHDLVRKTQPSRSGCKAHDLLRAVALIRHVRLRAVVQPEHQVIVVAADTLGHAQRRQATPRRRATRA